MVRPYYSDESVTIYHGDCRETLPQVSGIDLVLTDPPYGCGRLYGPEYDDSRTGYWEWFIPCFEILRQSAPVLAMTHRQEAMRILPGWDWVMCWHKPYAAMCRIGNSPILPHWEPILLWGIHSLGTRRDVMPDVLSVNPEPPPQPGRKPMLRGKATAVNGEVTGHPLPKPVALFKRLVAGLSLADELVCDPFAGSGTTLVAAKALGRRAIGIEVTERYCEIAANRCRQMVLL